MNTCGCGAELKPYELWDGECTACMMDKQITREDCEIVAEVFGGDADKIYLATLLPQRKAPDVWRVKWTSRLAYRLKRLVRVSL